MSLIDEYYGIDQAVLKQEQRAMLNRQRGSNEIHQKAKVLVAEIKTWIKENRDANDEDTRSKTEQANCPEA